MTTSQRTYERITVNLIEQASRDLDLTAIATGDTKTDTVNRALRVCAWLVSETRLGNEVLIRDGKTGETSIVKFL